MESSAKTQYAIRRSTRLPLEIPVLLTSIDADLDVSEQCNTTLVNAHGCGLIISRELTRGARVRLEISSANRQTTARVAEVVPLGGNPETWLAGMELDHPGNFWGIEYAPSDWKIEAAEAPPAEQHASDPEPTAAKPMSSRRWRLSDISAGACYLETAAPFPIDAPVLVSIRSSDAEFLLDGVVRVSHDQSGMGVEFMQAQAPDQRARVEELIGKLGSGHETPRIFVGRKEGKHAVQHRVSDSIREAKVPDPLRYLIRGGASLTVEQFLDDLRAQRVGKRRDPRIELSTQVLLTGDDLKGRPLDQTVTTINVSRRGALLDGIRGPIGPGTIAYLIREQKKEQFRVAWVGTQEASAGGKIGVAALDPDSSFWNEALAETTESAL
jgi:hypothetical protein